MSTSQKATQVTDLEGHMQKVNSTVNSTVAIVGNVASAAADGTNGLAGVRELSSA